MTEPSRRPISADGPPTRFETPPRWHEIEHPLTAMLHLGVMAAAIVTWSSGWWPITVVLWGVLAWMNHAALTRLHEAAHGTLSRSRVANEGLGILIGTASGTPLGVYRYVHAMHHAHLGRSRDPEFWPYSLPEISRGIRCLYAWSELLAGWIVTPLLYSVRTALAWPTLSRRRRRGLAAEWLLLVGVWTGLILTIGRLGWWEPFVVGHLVGAWLAGTLQTLRKFVEHLGMTGDTILSMTRTVSYRGGLGRAASRSQLHVDHHGTHHRWARIPFQRLPAATRIAYGDPSAGPVYPTHLHALRHMLPSLVDPRVGPQWGHFAAGSAVTTAPDGSSPNFAQNEHRGGWPKNRVRYTEILSVCPFAAAPGIRGPRENLRERDDPCGSACSVRRNSF